MTVQALYTAATGMGAMEAKLDVIANNLANINTTGFKKDRANFEDLFYRDHVLPGAEDSSGNLTATGTKVGVGVRMQSVQTEFRQGTFQLTGNPLDMAIEGNGFFRVTDPATGGPVYTRSGTFAINANGNVVLGSAQTGRLLEPNVQIDEDVTGVVINPNGEVLVRKPGDTTLSSAGTLEVATFINPQGLLKLGENLYQETDASGAAQSFTPGTNGAGIVRQNALEASNVEPVHELIDLITTQRSFELNSQAVQAGDQVLQEIANLRRF